jgi:hypothetical protein
MNLWIDKLIDDYYKFLKERTAVITDTGTEWAVISTPFIGPFNDTLEMYAKKHNNIITLSDDGITLKNLELQGISLTHSPKRKDLFNKILLTYNIICTNDELFVEATEINFAQKKHDLIMAMSEINDMYMISNPAVTSLFKEDVKTFFDNQGIIYTPQFISRGKTGLEFTFDFQLAYRTHEIIIKSFNKLDKMNIPNFLFTWDDVKSIREQLTGKNINGIALINDTDKIILPEYIEALKSRNADYILWSEKDKPENINKLKPAA